MNYRRNEDKWPVEALRPLFNKEIESTLSDSAGSEPVSVAEVKEELSIDFADHDAYLTKLIKRCRQRMELFCGISLVPKEVVSIIQNELGNMELPYGPVTEPVIDIELSDKEGTSLSVDSYWLRGVKFLVLETPVEWVRMNYQAGYTAETITDDLKQALIRVVAHAFSNRGDESNAIGQALMDNCFQYIRPWKR